LPSLRSRIEVSPIAQSYLVSIAATARTPTEAVRIADAFADATVGFRRRQFDQEIGRIAQRLRTVLRGKAVNNDPFRAAVGQRLAALAGLQGAADPSFRLLARASSARRSSPGAALVLGLGALVGLIIGLGAAFISDALLSRVKRERQLAEAFGLPVLAHVPKLRGMTSAGPLASDDLPPAALEAFRTLHQNLAAWRRPDEGVRVLAITSAGPGEGKTTAALNAAIALAQSGQRVLLVDGDLRRPAIGVGLSLASPHGTVGVLSGDVPLSDAMVSVTRHGCRLDVLPMNPAEGLRFGVLTSTGVDRLLAQAADMDWIIFDTSPLDVVADALPIAAAADDVVIVAKRSRTRLASLRRLLETLGRVGVSPRGFVFIGSRDFPVRYEHYVGPPNHARPAGEERVAR
jgi:Mrp family chromosome partitioning ATPase